MSLVYHGKLGISGYYEYARRDDGQWFSRYYSVTRTGSFRKPDPWRPVSQEFNLRLTQAINPDAPPRRVPELELLQERGVTVKLP